MALLSAILFAPFASAEVVLDQEYVVGFPGTVSYYLDYPEDHLAQTFTVRHSGILTGLEIQVSLFVDDRFRHDPPIDDLHISVIRVDSSGFALVDDVLAKATIYPNELPITDFPIPGPMAAVDVSSWNARVNSGDQLAITFASEQTDHSGPAQAANYLWFRSIRDMHPGGRFSIYSPRLYGPTPLWDFVRGPEIVTCDAGFRIYIDAVPEPSALALLIFGWAMLTLRRR